MGKKLCTFTVKVGGYNLIANAKSEVEVSLRRENNDAVTFTKGLSSKGKLFYIREVIMEEEVAHAGKARSVGKAVGAASMMLKGGGAGDVLLAAKRGERAGDAYAAGSTARVRLFDIEDQKDVEITIGCPPEVYGVLTDLTVPES